MYCRGKESRGLTHRFLELSLAISGAPGGSWGAGWLIRFVLTSGLSGAGVLCVSRQIIVATVTPSERDYLASHAHDAALAHTTTF